MAGRTGGLGRSGLDSVFGGKKEVEGVSKKETTVELATKLLVPNPYQPRKKFESNKMKELVDSIKEQGIIQPLIVRQSGKKYEIVAGERRWRAAKVLNLPKVPVVIRKYDDAAMKAVALVENMQRSDLDPIEEAQGMKRMMDELGITQAEVAKRLGKSRAAVTNALRLLNLPAAVQGYVSEGRLSVGQVRPLLTLEDETAIDRVAKMATQGEWSARIMEEFVAAEKEGKKPKVTITTVGILAETEAAKNTKKAKKEKTQPKDVHAKDFAEKLQDYLGTKVKVKPNKDESTGGKIVIEYYSLEDLDRVYELLQKAEEKAKVDALASKFHV